MLTMILSMCAFSMVGPVLTSVAPYHLRGITGAVGAIYLFFIGATGGAVLAAGFDQAFGARAAVLIVMIPTTIIGGFMIIRGSHFIRNDLSLVVLELQEEQEEHERQAADPESIPVLQLNNVDFSYGHVQVLFSVAFEVRRGEVLALLGTNGAGKSTALKVAAGLVTADRGVVRLNGRTVTYATPEQRSRLGIHLLPGGRGVFGEMTGRWRTWRWVVSPTGGTRPDLAGASSGCCACSPPSSGKGPPRRHALGWAAADAGPRHRAAARPAGAHDRRALPRARPHRRAGAYRGGRAGSRPKA